jgi:hypothetical protein
VTSVPTGTAASIRTASKNGDGLIRVLGWKENTSCSAGFMGFKAVVGLRQGTLLSGGKLLAFGLNRELALASLPLKTYQWSVICVND